MLSTAVGILTCEIVLRSFALVPSVKPIAISDDTSAYQRSKNPVLGFELKASYRNPSANNVFSYRSTNSHGQRDIERSIAKPAGVKRIVLLGDSVVEGMGIGNIDETISRQLEQLYTDGKTEVLNFGVSGYCTLAEVELLEAKGVQFSPDIVVLVFLDNDFMNLNVSMFPFGSPIDRPVFAKQLFLHSHLFRSMCLQFNLFDFGAEADPVSWNGRAIGENNVGQGLSRLRSLSHCHGFHAIIAIWPRFTDNDIIDVTSMPDRNELVIEHLARMHGIPTYRLSEYYKEHWKRDGQGTNPRLLYTFTADQVHPNVLASGVAAQTLQAILASPSFQQPPHIDQDQLASETVVDTTAVNAARLRGDQQRDLGNAHYLFNVGHALQSQGMNHDAIEKIRQALQLAPDFAEAHDELGSLLAREGNLKRSVEHFRLAIQLKPGHPNLHMRLAAVLKQAGQTTEALEQYREAMRLRDNWPEAMNSSAWILAASANATIRNPLEAERLARRAADLTGRQEPAILDTLAVAQAALGRFDEAISNTESALELLEEKNIPRVLQEVSQRLELYEQGQVYVENSRAEDRRPKTED